MNMRPRASLGRVVDDLGATLLDLVHGEPDSPEDIGGIVIHDPVDDPVLPPHALVLGVGLHDPDEIARLLADLGKQQTAALILRAPVPTDGVVAAAAERSGVVVLGLTRGASWAQLAAMLRSLLAEGDVGVDQPETLGGISRPATCSPWPTPSPRCSTRRSRSRTAARACWRSPDGRTKPTPPGSRRSSAARCPNGSRGC